MLTTDNKFGEVLDLKAQYAPEAANVGFRKVMENANGGIVLLTFAAGQNLAEHLAPAEVMVYVVEGEIHFSMMGTLHTLRAGEFLLMGEGVPHSVVATTAAKVMLVKIKSDR